MSPAESPQLFYAISNTLHHPPHKAIIGGYMNNDIPIKNKK